MLLNLYLIDLRLSLIKESPQKFLENDQFKSELESRVQKMMKKVLNCESIMFKGTVWNLQRMQGGSWTDAIYEDIGSYIDYNE